MLPKPNNPAIKLEQIDAKRFTVMRFSGMAGATSLVRHTDELQDFVRAKNLNAVCRHLRLLQSALEAAFFAPKRSDD